MPGVVVFKRRWSVGSDDFVVPGIFLLVLHTVWLVVLSVILSLVDFGLGVGGDGGPQHWSQCVLDLHEHVVGYIVILTGCIVVEGFISWVSMRGTILYTAPRASMQYLLYVRLGILLVEFSWLVVGVVWFSRHYNTCPLGVAKKAVLGIIVCNWCVLLSVMVTVWCTFDAAGRTWVKMKRYQRSLKEGNAKFRYRRSGNSLRNWRHRKAVREYQDSWNKRCRLLFCCMGGSDRNRNSFADIAKLLSEFFRDLDVVPSDVVAGLVLLRKFQRLERQATVKQRQNDIYQFLSGVAISPSTKFLDITHPNIAQEVQNIAHYVHYALAVYGWPMFMIINSATGCCQLCPYLRCCCLNSSEKGRPTMLMDDNCCQCNYAALQKLCKLHNMEIIFASYHVEVGETPFFVALDHEKRTVVVSIRGTLSLQDVLTDLNAEGEHLPTEPQREDWLGHKGMVQVAEYIRRKLVDEAILHQAFNHCPEKGTPSYDLVLVGHSLGAGAAAILAILLRQQYANLICYAYSPPGGLLSMPAVEYSKPFITSVVLGKDVVPRIGLHQMETLRSDLINAIKRSVDPKWKIIFSGVLCCCSENDGGSGGAGGDGEEGADAGEEDSQPSFLERAELREVTCHPSDSSIALTMHQPLYPPGRIIHIVRNHLKNKENSMTSSREPVFQAVLADNTSFDEVLISPVMIQDHMPDKVLDALEKLLVNTGPVKPQRHLSEQERRQLLGGPGSEDTLERTPRRLVLETSFTDLQPDALLGAPDLPLLRSSPAVEIRPTIPAHAASCDQSGATRESPCSGGEGVKRLDLLHWTGSAMAPMASPETLSEVSSISSKGSCQQRLSNGVRLSWGGVPVMEPIAQSPASRTLVAMAAEEGLVCLPHGLLPAPGRSGYVGQQVVQAEVEPSHEGIKRTRPCDPSQLSLNLQGVPQAKAPLESTDSTYASTERTPREPKRVTFELCGSEMAREESTDSVYNSGDSFVPSYPEDGCFQQEYGSHLYMYKSFCGSPNVLGSPVLEHSASEGYLLNRSVSGGLQESEERRLRKNSSDEECGETSSATAQDSKRPCRKACAEASRSQPLTHISGSDLTPKRQMPTESNL